MNETTTLDRAAPAALGDPTVVAAIRTELDTAGGRLTFARFMELALYQPERGYYLAPERRPGRGGDFLTAPETHPFFGLTLARQVAECWERLGRPRPFVVREYGAGVGGLAYDVIAGLSTETSAILGALDYRLVEPNRHRLDQALAAMAEVGLAHLVTAEGGRSAGDPLEPIVGVVLANEVADAFPVHRLIGRDGGLRERYVVWRDDARGGDGGFAEEEGELSAPELGAALLGVGIAPRDGDALDVSPAAAAWFATAASGLGRGYAIVIDYGYPATELYRAHRLRGTLRAYHGHTVSDDPFRHVGQQDLTAHVDFTALQRAGEAAGLRFAGFTDQGRFLTNLGLGDFLVQLRDDPETALPDYLAAQAAVIRLIDPGGMGRFGVLVMARDAPTEPPLRGLRTETGRGAVP